MILRYFICLMFCTFPLIDLICSPFGNLSFPQDLLMAVAPGPGETSEGPDIFTKAAGVLSSFSRFLKALSN